jgi:hypothetical protein
VFAHDTPQFVGISRTLADDDSPSVERPVIEAEYLRRTRAWYSIVHVPDESLAQVFSEFHRVLAPDGHLLLAFQVGEQPRELDEAFGDRLSR